MPDILYKESLDYRLPEETAEEIGRLHEQIITRFGKKGYKAGGVQSMFFAARETIKFKLRHPLTTVAYITYNRTPVSYRLFCRSIKYV